MPRFKAAFSLLELLLVIVILGIMTSFSAEMIANIYGNYILQRTQHRTSIIAQMVSMQIENRLQYAIASTIHITPNKLQWVGADMDGFESITSQNDLRGGWSGVCDVNRSHGTTVFTPASNLHLANSIIQNLSIHKKSILDAYIYFATDNKGYSIQAFTKKYITLSQVPRIFVEHYTLAWSAYAVVLEKNNLYLYYHFTPLALSSLDKASKSLLAKNVKQFTITHDTNHTSFTLCIQENKETKFAVSSCQKKVVFH